MRAMNEWFTSEKRAPSWSPVGKVLLSAFAAMLLFTGCAEHPGLAAYRQGDYAGTLRQYRAGGDPVDAFAAGVMHYKGEGVKRDARQAAVWFRRAAEMGHAGAQYN